MTIKTINSYIADDGAEFETEKECVEWENSERVYILYEKYSSMESIHGIYKQFEQAVKEKARLSRENTHYSYRLTRHELKDGTNGSSPSSWFEVR